MSFFKKISDFVPITNTSQPQEVAPEQTQVPQSQPSFGIAETPDSFENAPNNLYYIEQQAQSATTIQPETTREITVEASSLFSNFQESAVRLNSRLPELMERLEVLKARKEELRSQVQENREQSFKAQEALYAVKESLENDNPIPDAVLPVIGSLGILGMLGGLPALPVIGGLAGALGLNQEYKQRTARILHELERKMGELDLSAEQMKQDMQSGDKETKKVHEMIAHEQRRLQEEAQGFQTQTTDIDAMVAPNQLLQESPLNQNHVQNDASPLENPLFRQFKLNQDGE